MRSLHFKLAALTGAAVVFSLLAAAGVLLAMGAADRALEAEAAAQQRLDLLTEVSARLSDFGLAAVADADSPKGDPAIIAGARARVEAVFTAVAAQVEPVTGAAARFGRGRSFAHLKADFEVLNRQIAAALADPDAPRRADSIRGALNGFAASAGPVLSLLVEGERRAVAGAREEVADLSARLRIGAVALALLVLAAAAALYRGITLPLLRRLREIDRAAAAIGRGDLDTRLAIGVRDELGVLMARFNRMAARLSRRERKVARDRAMLERTVAERTADLTAANDRLAAIDASRRRFFADVSHELRTPLTVIIGECDVTQRAAAIPEDTSRAVLATIRKRAGLMHRRVEDLLRVARSESGEMELVFQDVEVQPILAEALAGLATAARRQNVTLTLAGPEPGPLVHADRDWLRQVVEGLVDNALRHGKGARHIAVSHEDLGAEVRICVTDDGCGIPPEERAGLFDRFARRGGLGAGSGFGLGLAIAEWVVTRHGGRITLESNEQQGGGTRVVMTLPKMGEGGWHLTGTP